MSALTAYIAAALSVLPGFFRRIFAGARRHPIVAALLLVITLLSVVMTARLSVYMWSTDNRSFRAHPGRRLPHPPLLPSRPTPPAPALYAHQDPNLYEADHYRPATADHGVELGALDQDPFQYPPVILLPFARLLKMAR